MRNFRKIVAYLMPVIVLAMIAGLILSRVYQPEPSRTSPERTVTAREAAQYEGRYVEVCGRVESARHIPQTGGKPTFLNLGRAYPDPLFTAVIWGEDRHRWQMPPEERYLTHTICVTGEVQMHRGVPQIRVRHPDQIRPDQALHKHAPNGCSPNRCSYALLNPAVVLYPTALVSSSRFIFLLPCARFRATVSRTSRINSAGDIPVSI